MIGDVFYPFEIAWMGVFSYLSLQELGHIERRIALIDRGLISLSRSTCSYIDTRGITKTCQKCTGKESLWNDYRHHLGY